MRQRADDPLSVERLRALHTLVGATASHTPVLSSASISDRCGGRVALKAENLQRTGSFKLRGALSKLWSSSATNGVVAGSAGNHGQSVAYAARASGLRCEVYMPLGAAVSKVEAVQAFGATVHLDGESVDDCVALARAQADDLGLTFVHPFDDHAVIAGQAGVGIELLQDVPDLRRVVVPVGGGGLISGIAVAIKSVRPKTEVIGVQSAACAPYLEARRAGATPIPNIGSTIADGIAVKHPGEITRPLVERWVDQVVAVAEDEIADAMILLLERSKLVVEGAGAASLAALLAGVVAPATGGTTVAVLSGGNVDVGLVAGLVGRQETRAGRRARLYTRVPDRPGGLAELLQAVAAAEVNLITVEHVRDGVPLHVRETGVDLTVATRDHEHTQAMLSVLRGSGYQVDELTRD